MALSAEKVGRGSSTGFVRYYLTFDLGITFRSPSAPKIWPAWLRDKLEGAAGISGAHAHSRPLPFAAELQEHQGSHDVRLLPGKRQKKGHGGGLSEAQRRVAYINTTLND